MENTIKSTWILLIASIAVSAAASPAIAPAPLTPTGVMRDDPNRPVEKISRDLGVRLINLELVLAMLIQHPVALCQRVIKSMPIKQFY